MENFVFGVSQLVVFLISTPARRIRKIKQNFWYYLFCFIVVALPV